MPLVQEALNNPRDPKRGDHGDHPLRLYSPNELVRYIMCCSQSVSGGFRDKPHKLVPR